MESIKAESLAKLIFNDESGWVEKTIKQLRELAPDTNFDSSKLKICAISLRLMSFQTLTLYNLNIDVVVMERFLKYLQRLYITRIYVNKPQEVLILLDKLIDSFNEKISDGQSPSWGAAKTAAIYLGDGVNIPLILGIQGLLSIWIGSNKKLFEKMLDEGKIV